MYQQKADPLVSPQADNNPVSYLNILPELANLS